MPALETLILFGTHLTGVPGSTLQPSPSAAGQHVPAARRSSACFLGCPRWDAPTGWPGAAEWSSTFRQAPAAVSQKNVHEANRLHAAGSIPSGFANRSQNPFRCALHWPASPAASSKAPHLAEQATWWIISTEVSSSAWSSD